MNGKGVSAVTSYTAHREWACRPPDERHASVHALYNAARARRLRTDERTIDTVALRTEAVASDALALRDTTGLLTYSLVSVMLASVAMLVLRKTVRSVT